MAGENTPGVASDIVDHFLHRQGKFDLEYLHVSKRKNPKVYEQARQKHFLAEDGLDNLQPGIYFADMGPIGADKNYHPIHGMTITVGENDEFEVHSMAYRIRDGAGNLTFPLGPTISDKAALKYYQQKLGIKFRVVQIARVAVLAGG